MSEVVYGLCELETSFLGRRDRRGAFATTYIQASLTVESWIRAGRFRQPDLVANYLVVFANAYRTALVNYERGDRARVPGAWVQAFDAADSPCSLLKTVLLSINAHVNRDLPHAVLEAGLDVNSETCHADHFLINEAVRAATPLVRKRLASAYQPRLRLANWIAGASIDRAVDAAFQQTRGVAWTMAKALQAAARPADREHVRQLIEARAVDAGHLILRSGFGPKRGLAALCDTARYGVTNASAMTS